MPYFHSAAFALNVPPNFIVSSLIFAFVSDNGNTKYLHDKGMSDVDY